MKILRMCALVIAVTATIGGWGSGCGGDDGTGKRDEVGADAGHHGGSATFAAFVIDLIERQTAGDTEPVAIDFGLPDPDQDNPDAFASLFQ